MIPDPELAPVFGIVADPIALQKAYRERRRRWAWKTGKPYAQDLEKPAPGVLTADADEEG